jgi:hypothetical protein
MNPKFSLKNTYKIPSSLGFSNLFENPFKFFSRVISKKMETCHYVASKDKLMRFEYPQTRRIVLDWKDARSLNSFL